MSNEDLPRHLPFSEALGKDDDFCSVIKCPICDSLNLDFGKFTFREMWSETQDKSVGFIIVIQVLGECGHKWSISLSVIRYGIGKELRISCVIPDEKERVAYKKYINSDAWREKANAAKERAGWRCQICNKSKDDGVVIDAHHRTYENLGNEKPEDITVLCRDCHALYHGKIEKNNA